MLPALEQDPLAPLFHVLAASSFSARGKEEIPDLWKESGRYFWILTLNGSVYYKAPNCTQYLTRGWAMLTRGSPVRYLHFDSKSKKNVWRGLFLCVGNTFSKERLDYVTSQFGVLTEIPVSSACVRLTHELLMEKQTDIWNRARLGFDWFHEWWTEADRHHRKILRLLDTKTTAATFARENLSLKTLAAQLGYSPGYLSGFLGRRWGETPSRLLRRERLKFAAKQLAESNIRVDVLANQLGYQSPSSFIRVFRQTYGMSPGKYRAKHGSRS